MDDNLQNLTPPSPKGYGRASKKERRELKRQQKAQDVEKKRKNRSTKRLALWVFVALIIAGAVFGIVKLASQTPSEDSPTASAVEAVGDADRAKGNTESAVVLIEYSDFQCPACATYHPLLKRLTADFNADIKFVYRHFPLKQIHKNAELAGRAAEAAGSQEKFWEMHDKIFEGQKGWSGKSRDDAEDIFVSYAEGLELDIEKFKSDLDAKWTKEKVEKDYQDGVRAGVNSTPTFFLNGTKLQNPRTYDEFRNLIQQAVGS